MSYKKEMSPRQMPGSGLTITGCRHKDGMTYMQNSLLIFLALLLTLPAHAAELAGFAALDTRAFLHGEAWPGQSLNTGPSLALEPEWYHVSEDGEHTMTFRPFFRADPHDGKRTHGDVRQLDWLYAADDWELRAGVSKVFWGVIESNHLIDIINQTDMVEDIDGEDKLGQPMMQLAWMQDWGTLRLYYLPYFRERTFPGYEGRLRGATPIEADRVRYASSAGDWHQDVAVRYSHYFGNWDVGVSHFSGTSREPGFIAETNNDGALVLAPYYETIDQSSLDLQYTDEGWLWKLETMTRSGHGDRFFAASAGLEYTFYQLFGSNADMGVLAEYHRDDRDTTAPATFFDDDVFLGTRITLNDIYDTEFLGGIVFDRHTDERFFSIESSRRLDDHWKIEFDARFYAHIQSSSIANGLRKDDHVQLRLSRYF